MKLRHDTRGKGTAGHHKPQEAGEDQCRSSKPRHLSARRYSIKKRPSGLGHEDILLSGSEGRVCKRSCCRPEGRAQPCWVQRMQIAAPGEMRKYCWFALAVPYKEQLLPSATMIVSRLTRCPGQGARPALPGGMPGTVHTPQAHAATIFWRSRMARCPMTGTLIEFAGGSIACDL